MFTTAAQQAMQINTLLIPFLTEKKQHLQVKNQSNNREEKDQKRPTKFTGNVTVRVHDLKDDDQIENQDDEANETTTVLEHIINHFVLFVYREEI